jgi:FtsP/CotA-like multicopper oxidase with cupredoxin domain
MLIVDEAALPEVDRDISSSSIIASFRKPSHTKPTSGFGFAFVNAATGRIARLRFDRHPVWVMAIDGQPAEPFLAREGRIVLTPGNRIDVLSGRRA